VGTDERREKREALRSSASSSSGCASRVADVGERGVAGSIVVLVSEASVLSALNECAVAGPGESWNVKSASAAPGESACSGAGSAKKRWRYAWNQTTNCRFSSEHSTNERYASKSDSLRAGSESA
jgi:hypothetical protein